MPGLISRLKHRFAPKKEAKRRKKTARTKRLHDDDDLHSPLSNETSFTHRTGTSVGLPPTLNQQDRYHGDDNSLPTMDPDYKHAHAGNCSLSDAGGTLGTQNQSLANFTHAGASDFGSVAPSAAGAFGTSSSVVGHDYYHDAPPMGQSMAPPPPAEEILTLHAPAGKLGLVIDTPAHASTPVVHAIKDTCPLKGALRVEDRLVAVDEVDVRDMSASEVSRLIGERSGQEWRRLTLVRATRGTDMGEGLFKC